MNNIYKGTVSYNLGKNILFDKIDYGENFLILYSNTNAHKQIFQNFMRQVKDNNSIVFFVSHSKNELSFSFDVRKFIFNNINDEVIQDLRSQLEKCFSEIEEDNKTMLLIADWSNADLSGCEIFLPFLKGLIEKSQSLNPPGWKRKYRGIQFKTPFFLVNAFEAAELDDEFVQELTDMHKRVYLMQENLNTFLLPAISPSQEIIFPKQHVLPQKLLENLVKDNLELVMLLFLEDGDKSGYQILKDIAKHFQCILSQGTLYPLLYQLEKEGKIAKLNGKGREVIYSLTEQTKTELKMKKENCLKGYQHLASFFERGGGGDGKKRIKKSVNKKNTLNLES